MRSCLQSCGKLQARGDFITLAPALTLIPHRNWADCDRALKTGADINGMNGVRSLSLHTPFTALCILYRDALHGSTATRRFYGRQPTGFTRCDDEPLVNYSPACVSWPPVVCLRSHCPHHTAVFPSASLYTQSAVRSSQSPVRVLRW